MGRLAISYIDLCKRDPKQRNNIRAHCAICPVRSKKLVEALNAKRFSGRFSTDLAIHIPGGKRATRIRSLLAYQACLNLSYIVSGLYSGEEHAALADGAAGALKRLFPSALVGSGPGTLCQQENRWVLLLNIVQSVRKKGLGTLFGDKAKDWGVQPCEASLCAWNRLESGAYKRRTRHLK